MILAVASSNAILTGLAILSTGLLVMSTSLLVLSWTRDSAMRQAIKDTYERVSREASPVLGAEFEKLDRLVPSIEEARQDLRGGGTRKEAQKSVKRARDQLCTERDRMQKLKSAQSQVLNLSIDELAFLTSEEDSNIAALSAYFQAVEQLKQELAQTR
jgi:sugar diacid utilization regulator